MFLFLTLCVLIISLCFSWVHYLPCMCGRLADEGEGSLRAVTEGEPAGMNAEKGGGYSKHPKQGWGTGGVLLFKDLKLLVCDTAFEGFG